MAMTCELMRTNLAQQTPEFQENFLNDFITDMMVVPWVGRHKTETWKYGDIVYFDTTHVMQPNFLTDWQVINSGLGGQIPGGAAVEEDCANPCEPPVAYVGYGTTRDHAQMEHLKLRSQIFCLRQLIKTPRADKQMDNIFTGIRQLPLGFTNDFIRSRTLSYHDTLRIANTAAIQAGTETFAISTANVPNATSKFINLGAAALLPDSQLTWTMLRYWGELLGMRGYNSQSGLAAGARSLITHSNVWFNLCGNNPEVRSLLALDDAGKVSPLYKMGVGINAQPFGNFVPIFDDHQMRYQHNGGGLLERVLPYLNEAATTGERPVENTAYLRAGYGISFIHHPVATLIYTDKPKKIHEMVPTVNTEMYGKWTFVNNQGALIYVGPDGTECTKNNEDQMYFYWLTYLANGFQYEKRNLIIPILHQLDGAGAACVAPDPVCSLPQYVKQPTDYSPDICEEVTVHLQS